MGYKYIDDKLEPYFDLIVDCCKLRGSDLDEQIKALAKDTRVMDNCLEEEILQMKLHAAQVRKEFESTVNQEVEKNTKTWEECIANIKSQKPKVDDMLAILKPLENEILRIDTAISNINIYKLERFIEIVKKISDLSAQELTLVKKLLSLDEVHE